MPKFSYKGVTRRGKVVADVLEAPSTTDALLVLLERRIRLTEVVEYFHGEPVKIFSETRGRRFRRLVGPYLGVLVFGLIYFTCGATLELVCGWSRLAAQIVALGVPCLLLALMLFVAWRCNERDFQQMVAQLKRLRAEAMLTNG